MTHAVPPSVADAVERAAREGRLIQGEWRRVGRNGEMLVNALAAFGPDINRASDCPSAYMPRWLAALIPALGDGIAAARLAEFVRALLAPVRQWGTLDDDAWVRVRVEFLRACVRHALDAAAPVQPTPSPAYWDRVRAACDATVAALTGEGDLGAACEAIWPWALPEGALSTQSAPTDAIWAARAAAESAYLAAGDRDTSVRDAAAAAAGTVWSAKSAAWWMLARRLISLLNTEIAAAKGRHAPLASTS